MNRPNALNLVSPDTKPGAEDNTTTAIKKLDADLSNIYVKVLVASAALDFPSTVAAAIADLTIAVPGALLGDAVILGVPNVSKTASSTFTAFVSAADTVTVRYSPKATEDPASGTFKVYVLQL